MPRMGGRFNQNEKSKDFFGSIKRLFINLKSWKIVIVIALILAMLSSVFSILAPNKLSDLADIIAKGLVPKQDKIVEIGKVVNDNFSKIDFKTKTIVILNSDIKVEDKLAYQNAMSKMSNIKSEEDYFKIVSEIPNSVLDILVDEIKYDNKKISGKDQVKFISVASKMMDKKISNNDRLKLFDELPKSIYDIVKPSINKKEAKSVIILLATLYLLSALFNYIQGFSLATVSNKFAKKLRSNITDKINKLPLKFFDAHQNGDVLSRVTNDVDMISMNMNQSLATLVSSLTLFLGSVIMMFVTNYIMAITAIFASLFGFIGMGLILKNSQKYFSKRQKELGKLNGYIEEIYSGHDIVKAYNGIEDSKKTFNKLNDNLYYANRKSQFLSGLMQPIMNFVGNFGYVAVCIVGALLVMNDYISFGVIVAFMVYVRLFTNPLSQIAQAMTSLQSTAAASERVFEFLDENEMSDQKEIIDKLDVKKAKGNIEFKDVSFGYNDDKLIIKNFSFNAKKGQKIAIVGPTGAGKTTIVNLLMKFYEINKGEILIDGKKVSDLKRENIHDLFTMVLQDTWLFEGTIRDNIKYNKKNIKDEDIWKVLKLVGVDHFVKTLPGGLDSIIDDSDSISQGQKQLFTIARAMLEDSPFLILDEATSNVDTRTEELVAKAMDKLTVGRTSFIIAHRLSTIKNSDLILVMKDGNIIEQGTHDELIEKKGFYNKLYNSQFQN